jgi:hypothetical protein
MVEKKEKMMQKVEMMVAGKRALVDSDMIKKMVRKDMLVATAMDLQTKMKSEKDPICFRLLSESMQETVGKIVRINRTIRKNVQFL